MKCYKCDKNFKKLYQIIRPDPREFNGKYIIESGSTSDINYVYYKLNFLHGKLHEFQEIIPKVSSLQYIVEMHLYYWNNELISLGARIDYGWDTIIFIYKNNDICVTKTNNKRWLNDQMIEFMKTNPQQIYFPVDNKRIYYEAFGDYDYHYILDKKFELTDHKSGNINKYYITITKSDPHFLIENSKIIYKSMSYQIAFNWLWLTFQHIYMRKFPSSGNKILWNKPKIMRHQIFSDISITTKN